MGKLLLDRVPLVNPISMETEDAGVKFILIAPISICFCANVGYFKNLINSFDHYTGLALQSELRTHSITGIESLLTNLLTVLFYQLSHRLRELSFLNFDPMILITVGKSPLLSIAPSVR